MIYTEPPASRKMAEMNRAYLELYYSGEYQALLKKKKLAGLIKEKRLSEILKILKGRLIKKKLVNRPHDASGEIKKDFGQIEAERYTWETDRLPSVVVYTCIVNGYDDLEEPGYINPAIDYVIFTDMEVRQDSIWKKRDISDYEQLKNRKPVEINRYVKLHPQEFFAEYDVSIYIDGTIMLLADMMPVALNLGKKYFGVHRHAFRDCIYMEAEGVIYSKRADSGITRKQMKEYHENGYPEHAGLYENTILVRRHNQADCIRLMEAWWDEYMKYPTRDQISLPYVMWKCRIVEKDIYILGNSIEKNYRFRRKTEHRK